HDRHRAPSWGLEGGLPGMAGRILLNPDGPNELELHSKSICDLKCGDVVSFATCGGGGWGDPLEREPSMVLHDVLHGLLSRDAARELFGVVLSQDPEPAVLIDETSALRLRLGADRSGHEADRQVVR